MTLLGSLADPAAEAAEVVEQRDIHGVSRRIVEDESREPARAVATAVEAMHENDQALGTQIAVAVKVKSRFIESKLPEARLITRIHHGAATYFLSAVARRSVWTRRSGPDRRPGAGSDLGYESAVAHAVT